MVKEIDQSEKKKKLEELLTRLTYSCDWIQNGNTVRRLTRIIAEAYKNNPVELKVYFKDENELIAGIATSAYHFLTGDIAPIQELNYGGLGAIINNSETGLKFSRYQLRFAKLSGNALQGSRNKDSSLRNTENSGDALRDSRNSGRALGYSMNCGNALQNSRNRGHTLEFSENSEDALMGSTNSDNSLWFARNIGNAKKYALNPDELIRKRRYSILAQQDQEYELRQLESGLFSRLLNSFFDSLGRRVSETRYSGTAGIFIPTNRD